ncbi:DUF7931 domain-containing protein [Thiolapillus brandeum]|uniref:DUF7931 domain-containing protein n=1 Tax=Thiolapillus brandeum TaxID=1076588 RepID=A0A7U6GHW7_9GAMM|nr:hypothetical protein [Thiolapillus brandeum]BAO43946.1 conserved hypothetical protein [Thiolapillus brandeum]
MNQTEKAFVLGETRGELHVAGLNEMRGHSCAMAAASRRRLLIYSHRLNPEIYGQSCFTEAVRQLVIRHAHTRIRILVADTTNLVRGGHGLVRLAQDMTSSMEIRRIAPEFEGDLRSFMLADEYGYILRNLWHDLNNGRADYYDPPRVRNLAEEFMLIWEQSEADPALRRLSL